MYTISSKIDNDKVFLINKSELNERLDPSVYQRSFSFVSNKYPNVKLIKLAHINPNVSFAKFSGQDMVSFVPMEVIDEEDGCVSEYRQKMVAETKGFTRFQSNDLIWAKITPCMQNGKSAIVRDLTNGYGCGSTEFFVIRPRDNNVLVEYLHFLLRNDRILKSAQNYFGGSAGQQRVPIEFLKNFIVPMLPIEEQQIIVSKIYLALSLKQEKQAKAKVLLDSIDGYLLDKLGIFLPTKDNNLKNRVFYTSFRAVSGNRFDTKPYDNNTTALKAAIANFDKNNFTVVRLSNILLQSIAGDWGEEEADENYIRCLVLRATEFDNNDNLNLDNTRVKYRYINKSKYKKIDISEDDLLIEKSGGSIDQPVGRVSILTRSILQNRTIAYSNFVHKIRVDKNIVNPQYLFYFLRTMYNIGVTEYMQSQTNGIRNLIMSEYLSQNIIIPIENNHQTSLKKQEEIVCHISDIRARAKSLQQEAQEILNNAKTEVERMILGE